MEQVEAYRCWWLRHQSSQTVSSRFREKNAVASVRGRCPVLTYDSVSCTWGGERGAIYIFSQALEVKYINKYECNGKYSSALDPTLIYY